MTATRPGKGGSGEGRGDYKVASASQDWTYGTPLTTLGM